MNLRGWMKGAIIAALVALALLTLFFDFANLTVGPQGAGGGNMLGMLSGLGALGGGAAASPLSALESGGVSLPEARELLSQVGQMSQGLAGLALGASSAMPSPGTISAGIAALTAALVLAFLTAALAVGMGFAGKRFLGIPFAVVMAAVMVAELSGIGLVNDRLRGMAALSATAWPVVGAALAAASAALAILLNRSGMSAPVRPAKPVGSGRTGRSSRGFKVISKAPAGGWVCPKCGARVEPDGRFCAACGAPKPEPRRCPKCAAECGESEAFCARCGCKLMSAPGTPAQNPRPVQNPRLVQNPQPVQRPAAPAQSAPQNANPGAQAWPAPQSANPGARAWPAQSGGVEVTVNPNAFVPEAFRNGQPAKPIPGTMRMTADGALMGATLTITVEQPRAGLRREYTVPLTDKLIIGRSPGCDVTIDDQAVSSHHLRIERGDDVIFVSDLNSSNGTRLNGAPLVGRAALGSGDKLIIGYSRVTIKW